MFITPTMTLISPHWREAGLAFSAAALALWAAHAQSPVGQEASATATLCVASAQGGMRKMPTLAVHTVACNERNGSQP